MCYVYLSISIPTKSIGSVTCATVQLKKVSQMHVTLLRVVNACNTMISSHVSSQLSAYQLFF